MGGIAEEEKKVEERDDKENEEEDEITKHDKHENRREYLCATEMVVPHLGLGDIAEVVICSRAQISQVARVIFTAIRP